MAEGLSTTADARANGSEVFRGHVLRLITFIEAAVAPTSISNSVPLSLSNPIAEARFSIKRRTRNQPGSAIIRVHGQAQPKRWVLRRSLGSSNADPTEIPISAPRARAAANS
jgi:hypothetical protein